MGVLDKIGDFGGDIVDGIIDGVDSVLGEVGINFKKIIGNDWVQGGLMAASIFMGGVAIVNGVMTGMAQATAAQGMLSTAAQGTMQGYASTFMAGAKGFIQGVASGLANPLDTAGSLFGQAKTALGMAPPVGGESLTGLQSSGDMLAGEVGKETSAQAMNMGQAPQYNLTGGATELSRPVGGALPNSIPTSMPGSVPQSLGGGTIPGIPGGTPPPMSMQDLLMSGGGDASMLTADGFAAGSSPSFNMLGGGGADALGTSLAANEQGLLASLAQGGKEFLSSPMGMMTATNALSGWAQGSMIDKRWEEMEKNEKARRRSWVNFAGTPAPSINIPSLQSLRERGRVIQDRGNQANAKYGY